MWTGGERDKGRRDFCRLHRHRRRRRRRQHRHSRQVLSFEPARATSEAKNVSVRESEKIKCMCGLRLIYSICTAVRARGPSRAGGHSCRGEGGGGGGVGAGGGGMGWPGKGLQSMPFSNKYGVRFVDESIIDRWRKNTPLLCIP